MNPRMSGSQPLVLTPSPYPPCNWLRRASVRRLEFSVVEFDDLSFVDLRGEFASFRKTDIGTL